MRPPVNGIIPISQLFGGNPTMEAYTTSDGYPVVGHTGLDIACPEGTQVYPCWNGKVKIVDLRPYSYGLSVHLIDDKTGRYAIYGHLSSVDVPDGVYIEVHYPFAKSGSTGNSTGPHLHFEIKPGQADPNNGYYGAIDPLPYFDHDVYQRLDLTRTNL